MGAVFFQCAGVATLTRFSQTSYTPKDTAVLLVDLQKDFTTEHNGSLAVEGTDRKYLDQVIQTIKKLHKLGFQIFATKDCHPKGHISFASTHPGKQVLEKIEPEPGRSQVLWPDHCVSSHPGSEILVHENYLHVVVHKGQHIDYDSYSGFTDDGGHDTGLATILLRNHLQRILVFGLASDYCVKNTVMDALKKGFEVTVVQDLCRGVAFQTTQKAWHEMKRKGAIIWPSMDFKKIKSE